MRSMDRWSSDCPSDHSAPCTLRYVLVGHGSHVHGSHWQTCCWILMLLTHRRCGSRCRRHNVRLTDFLNRQQTQTIGEETPARSCDCHNTT